MAGGDLRLRTSTSRESIRSSDPLRPCRGVCSYLGPTRDPGARSLRSAEKVMKPADVTLLRQDQPTEVNPTVPHMGEPAKSDLEAVAELAEAHAQIVTEIEKRIIGQ